MTFRSATPRRGCGFPTSVNLVGQNQIAINFVWTLVTGFLVMFMQAGFAIVETGLCRAKNANHTMMMNFMVYGVGMLAYWLIGFAIQEGGVGAVANLGGTAPLNAEYTITLFGKTLGLVGMNGNLLMHHGTYDVGVMVMFLFQMVFMDTALTIVTGTAAERWKYVAFVVSSFVMGAFTYPLFANWAWGGGWLATLGSNFGLGHGYLDFAGSGVVHSVGGVTALAMGIMVGPALANTPGRESRTRFRSRHHARPARVLHPGVRVVRIQPRLDARRIGQWQPADQLGGREHDARGHGGLLRRDALYVDTLREAGCVHVR
jgi:Amt family ammonium transporter